uniref:Si:ch211-93g23.2 n=1 Tax=Oryzias latipes TaxID=8090 RepID=A0A3P9LK69_ORYLA
MAVRLFEAKNHAASYLRYRVSPHELITRIMDFMEEQTPKQYNLAVDVGCGSGQGTILLAQYFAKVVGTDVSPAQLEMASTNDKPLNVSYRECPAEELPFANGEVDLVTAMTAAHWFDRQRFLQEADRVLRPGGCLALLSYSMDMKLEYGDISDSLNDICEEFYATLLPYRSSYIGSSSKNIYLDLFNSCSYPDKEWNNCVPVRRAVTLSAYIGMVQTFSSYECLKQKDPEEAERLSNDIQNNAGDRTEQPSQQNRGKVLCHNFYLQEKVIVCHEDLVFGHRSYNGCSLFLLVGKKTVIICY